MQQCGLSYPGEYLRFFPYNVTGMPRQRNRPQIKEWIKTSEKELMDEEIGNLSNAEFQTLVISMLTGMIEYRHRTKV